MKDKAIFWAYYGTACLINFTSNKFFEVSCVLEDLTDKLSDRAIEKGKEIAHNKDK